MAYEEILTTSSPIKEAKLSWGGGNFSGGYGCIDAAMVGNLGANRSAFIKPAGVQIEYSTNGGSTWTDYGASDAQKVMFFTNFGASFVIGKNSTKGAPNTNYLLRVTVTTDTASIYTQLNKFVIYVSTNGSQNCYCTIDAKLKSNVDSGTDTWAVFANKVPVSGWSGYNVINTSTITTYGNSPTYQYQKLRFTFGCSSTTANYTGLSVMGIQCYGGVGWTTPSTMARTGTLFTYDANQNVAFPASVTAPNFNGSLNGNASTATSATTASAVKDSGNSANLTFSCSKSGLGYNDYTWIAAWNGNELRAVNKSQFITTATTSGSGNAVTDVTSTNGALTIKKDKTFSGITRSTKANFPTTGDNNQLYVDTSTKKMYIWI